MKLLKINEKKCYFSTDGVEYKPISDISKDDIYSILNYIYINDDFELDEYNETTEIASDVEKLIYSNLYNQLQTFIQNKTNLVNEINNELSEVLDKYRNDLEDEATNE